MLMARITPNILRLGIAGLSLLSAISVYLFLRLDPPALLEPFHSSLQWFVPPGELSGCLPSFFYTLSIGLLLAAVASNLSDARLHCLIWVAIALVLELTQHALVAERIAGFLEYYSPGIVVGITGPYWIRGVFDPFDLIATVAGGMLAMALLSCLPGEE
jgi:hypothetical protein